MPRATQRYSDQDLQRIGLGTWIYPESEPDFETGSVQISWDGPDRDVNSPRQAEHVWIVAYLGADAYLVEEWERRVGDTGWFVKSVTVYEDEFKGLEPSFELASGIGQDHIQYAEYDERYPPVSDLLTLLPSSWVRERWGDEDSFQSLDPFTGELVWVFRGGRIWEQTLRDRGVRRVPFGRKI